MNWILVLLTAGNLQSVGYYEQQSACQSAAKEWQSQGVKSGCVQQQTPEAAVAQMQKAMEQMIKGVDKLNK
jgi:hypothetical protein